MFNAEEYGRKVIGPIIYEYITWLLNHVKRRKVYTIFFLARDGYLLKEAAEIICRKQNYHIQCKYLYCSRMALRMPTYWFIGEEAFELLFQGGYHITPYALMCRLNLNLEERKQVYADVGVVNENNDLTTEEYQLLIERLKKSEIYNKLMCSKSLSAYDDTISYFKQEGLFDYNEIVIVDSGWSGSMQRSMRQLLEHEGFKGKISGFYFGMYNEPKEQADGTYVSYYFNAFSKMKYKVYFDNTLFECMLAAPHGMTIGYFYDKTEYKPILKSDLNAELLDFLEAQKRGVLKYIEGAGDHKFILKQSVRKCYKILKRATLYPTKEETDAYCSFKFCDDVSEAFSATLVQKDKILLLQNYMIIPKIIAKIKNKKDVPVKDIFWPFGMINYVGYPLRVWYRWNIILLQYFRHLRTAIQERKRISSYE
jgi:hypothetical protein